MKWKFSIEMKDYNASMQIRTPLRISPRFFSVWPVREIRFQDYRISVHDWVRTFPLKPWLTRSWLSYMRQLADLDACAGSRQAIH